MKKIIIICAVIFMTASVFAQAPNKMSYQAVIRSNNALVTNSAVGMRISILQTTPSGTAVYVETQTPTSNDNGLVSLEIGSGTVVSGNFTTIDWANGPYFINTETDPTGGTNYTITGTSQLLSVPYALYAATAGPTYSIGDFAHGGIVFWVDETGNHGLVCAKSDQSDGVRWYAGIETNTMARGTGPKAGERNTAIIIANQGAGDGNTYAARICNELEITEGGITYGDWYLPSLAELYLMNINQSAINTTAAANGGSYFSNEYYWSSTEISNSLAYDFSFLQGSSGSEYKENQAHVRAVRAF